MYLKTFCLPRKKAKLAKFQKMISFFKDLKNENIYQKINKF